MSIGRRFLNMARSELNSLLDYAARRGDGEDGRGGSGTGGGDGRSGDDEDLHGYSEQELKEELERRRRARDEVEEALHGGRRTTTPPRSGANDWRTKAHRPSPTAAPSNSEAMQVQRAYAALELPAGSDFEAVRKSYRALMRKYHPDHHTGSPEKQRAANEVAQRLTESYKLLEKRLRR